jgi:extradiol dioxygenase family protein
MKLYSNIEVVEGKQVFRTDHLGLIFEVDGWFTLQRRVIYMFYR